MYTQDQKRRIVESLNETIALIEKEEKYSKEFIKKDYLSFLYTHKTKLINMLSND